MAKRHADGILFSQSPSKRKLRPGCRVVDLHPEKMAANVDVSPSCTPALLSENCMKRRRSVEFTDMPQNEIPIYRETTKPEPRGDCASHALTYGNSREYNTTTSRKRRREDPVGLETDNKKTDTDFEDCTYNSFQYWRVPLPELDLSLLEETAGHSSIKPSSNVKDILDAMES
ncbi:uncharacterized protein LOC144195565 [Stigmatopora nigra]